MVAGGRRWWLDINDVGSGWGWWMIGCGGGGLWNGLGFNSGGRWWWRLVAKCDDWSLMTSTKAGCGGGLMVADGVV